MTETDLEIQTLRRQLEDAKQELAKSRETLYAVQDALQWTRDKLIDAQEELRRVKFMLMRDNA